MSRSATNTIIAVALQDDVVESSDDLAHRIITRHIPLIRHLIGRNMHFATDADKADVFQEICMSIVRSVDAAEVRSVESAGPWVTTIARRRITDYKRGVARSIEGVIGDDDINLVDTAEILPLDAMTIADILNAADLTPEQYTALGLRFIEHRTQTEIAVEMGVSTSVVERHHRQGLQKMRFTKQIRELAMDINLIADE